MIFKIVRKVKTVLTYFLVYYPIYFFSFLTPRKKNRWVFGAGYNFAENPKYLYLEVLKKNPEIEAYWITKERNVYDELVEKKLPVAYIWSLKGINLLFTAGVYIAYSHLYESIFFWSLGRAKQVNLWHGIALKNVGFSKNIKASYYRLKHPLTKYIYRVFLQHLYRKPNLFLATSDFTVQEFKKSFDLHDKHIVEADYPRCTILHKSGQEIDQHILDFESVKTKILYEKMKAYSKVILYMPTWRDGDSKYLEKTGFNYSEINKLCKQRNLLFIFKLHPKTPLEQLKGVEKYSNLLIVDSKLDFYPLLPFVNLLITDYSSIYFDFMHVKDVYTLFFPFDYETYIKRDRDLAFDYDENINGIRVNTFDELLDSLKTESYKNIDIEKNKVLYEKFWGKPEDKKDLILEIKTLVGLS